MEFGMTLAVVALVVAVALAFGKLASAEKRITWLEQEVRRLSGGVQPSERRATKERFDAEGIRISPAPREVMVLREGAPPA